MLKKHVIILCREKEFESKKNKYIQKTGMAGKGYSFNFIIVTKKDFYIAIEQLKKLNQIDPLSHLYVVDDYDSGKDFVRRIKATLNKRFKKLLNEIIDSKKIVINLKKDTFEDLFSNDISDKKKQKFKHLRKVA